MFSKILLLCVAFSAVYALPPQAGWWGGASFNPWMSWIGGGAGASPWSPVAPSPPESSNHWLPWLAGARQPAASPVTPVASNPFLSWGAASPWAPQWAPCSTIGADCLDCKTKVMCTKVGGIQSSCTDPLLPYCNLGQCSATPSASCGTVPAVPAHSGQEFPGDEYTK